MEPLIICTQFWGNLHVYVVTQENWPSSLLFPWPRSGQRSSSTWSHTFYYQTGEKLSPWNTVHNSTVHIYLIHCRTCPRADMLPEKKVINFNSYLKYIWHLEAMSFPWDYYELFSFLYEMNLTFGQKRMNDKVLFFSCLVKVLWTMADQKLDTVSYHTLRISCLMYFRNKFQFREDRAVNNGRRAWRNINLYYINIRSNQPEQGLVWIQYMITVSDTIGFSDVDCNMRRITA